MKFSNIKELSKLLSGFEFLRKTSQTINEVNFKPTAFLSHPFLQSVYNLAEPTYAFNFQREKLFFQDGGHVALDWSPRVHPSKVPPVLFIMHGLTGGSEMNYIKALAQEAIKEGYQCVCLNSRGINTEMTSPIPFVGIEHNELKAALDSVQQDYPESPIYLVGTSFGGNYLLRYLIHNENIPYRIKALIALAPPLNVKKVVEDMGPIYQRFFVRRYIYETITKHQQMKYWERIGLIDMKEVLKSQTLHEYHSRVSAQILGLKSADELFDHYHISAEEIGRLKTKTLFMTSKDDPIVSYSSMPHDQIKANKNIKFIATEKGGHLCWFEGMIPKRWYPKPTLEYLRTLREEQL